MLPRQKRQKSTSFIVKTLFKSIAEHRARNHENSDEFRPTPLRHLDLDTPAFYYYRKNPKCYHTVWGKNLHNDKIKLVCSYLRR